MENIQKISDISKEALTFLAFFDNDVIKKIPSCVIEKLSRQAADSKSNFYVDANKNFSEQKISEKTKDLIALIYYNYIADENEKKEILEQWNLNEKTYIKIQNEKYSYENLFKNKESNVTSLVEIKKDNFFKKIMTKIKNIFFRVK